MTSRDFLSDSVVFEELGEMSFYEDALDLSEDELQKLCNDTVRHLRQTQRNQLSRLTLDGQSGDRIESASMANSPKPSHVNIQSSSSGDNSSIERISYGRRSNVSETQNANGQQSSRSRHSTRRRGAQRSNNSSNGDWKVVNSFDYSYFPTLFQIDKQIQLVLRELRRHSNRQLFATAINLSSH
ncbi:hypothetical protein M3Y97_00832900 [Aphelenchoides bicaudatus]|nr:hypothetical protein M3Y97_00832900 [Aphelenchoides bicaudatus]